MTQSGSYNEILRFASNNIHPNTDVSLYYSIEKGYTVVFNEYYDSYKIKCDCLSYKDGQVVVSGHYKFVLNRMFPHAIRNVLKMKAADLGLVDPDDNDLINWHEFIDYNFGKYTDLYNFIYNNIYFGHTNFYGSIVMNGVDEYRITVPHTVFAQVTFSPNNITTFDTVEGDKNVKKYRSVKEMLTVFLYSCGANVINKSSKKEIKRTKKIYDVVIKTIDTEGPQHADVIIKYTRQ